MPAILRIGARTSFLTVILLSLSARGAAPPEENDRATPRVSALAFVGVYSYQNVDRTAYRPGPRAGGLVGVRLVPWLSLNGEVTYDKSWIQAVDGGDTSEYFLDFALSPLVHWTRGRAELVFGPEVGYFRSSATSTSMAATAIAESSSGLALGLNAGAFARVSRSVSLGGMLSVEMRHAQRYCETRAGMAETCTTNEVLDSAVVLHDADLVALTFAALF